MRGNFNQVITLFVQAVAWTMLIAVISGGVVSLIITHNMMSGWLWPLVILGLAIVALRIDPKTRPLLASICVSLSAGILYPVYVAFPDTLPAEIRFLSDWAVETFIGIGLLLAISLAAMPGLKKLAAE